MAGIAVVPDVRREQRVEAASELRYPVNSVVLLAGVPGAGKSTLLRRLFPGDSAERAGVQVLDSERTRVEWMPMLGSIPYTWWRPFLHLAHYARVLRALRRRGPFLMHDCATRPLIRRLIGWRARRSGLAVHLVLLDVPDDVALSGQHARGRVIRSRSMATHCRRWATLRPHAKANAGRIIPGAVSAVVLNRRQANALQKLTFAAG